MPSGAKRLAALALGQLLAHDLHPLRHELQAVSTPLGTRDCLFDGEEGLGVVQFLAQLFHEGMDF